MIDTSLYRDREQSFIKHQFLTRYLQAAAYKTLQGHSPVFNFVDAFAGPWRVSDDARYSDASFDQAINTLEAVRADLGKRGVGGLKIRFCLCEKRADRVSILRNYAASRASFDIHIFEGLFEENLDGIAAVLTEGFTFTFIDPTGWNIDSAPVFSFLRAQGGEFLLNFMADHINRHASYNKVSASFGRFLADAKWEDDFKALPASWSDEQRVLHLLKDKIRSSGTAKYVPDFSIMVPRKERLKMRLILGTHSSHGLEVFRDVQEKVEKQEMAMRLELKDGESPQVSMFSSEDIAAIQQESRGVGCRANQIEAERIVIDFLRGHTYTTPGPIYNLAMEEIAIRRPHLNRLLLDMRKRGVVSFDLPPRKKVPQVNTQISLI